MNASEGLLRGIAWRLAFLVFLVFIARNVADNRPQMVADAHAVTTSVDYTVAGR